MSNLTFMQYQNLDSESRNWIHNRVRQRALKVRNYLPNEHGMFCLVLAHLLKNAHRYFDMQNPSGFQQHILEEKAISDVKKSEIMHEFKVANKEIREVTSLNSKNRLKEQKELVAASRT